MANFDSALGPKKPKGFNVKSYGRNTNQLGQAFKRRTKEVKLSGIQSEDQRSSNEYTTRVPKGKNKAASMTYGATKNNKGTTVYKKGKKK